MPVSGLADPPDDLDRFPVADDVDELHRLSEWPGVWWFCAVDAVEDNTGGRFDLVKPRGTCYFAEGSLVEKLLRTPVRVVPAERLDELFHAVVTVHKAPSTADLTSAEATGYGLDAEIHTTRDY